VASQITHVCVGWGPWPSEPFLDKLQAECARRGLTCLICRDENVQRVIRSLETGQRHVLLHLDAQADYEDASDPYGRLGYAVRDGGGVVVNEPDVARAAANKAITHYRMTRARVPVPYTVVVRNWEPTTFKLTPTERRRLGRPFIMKPARGFGREGVVKVDRGSVREIAKARRFDKGDDFLLQQFIEPIWFGHHMGWFRVYNVLGETVICWWDTQTQHYTCVTLDEFRAHELSPLLDIVRRITAATGMNYFSTEVAVAGTGTRRRFLAIDYVNDQCDMTLQSLSHCGVPDVLVQHVAERFADTAWRLAQGAELSEGSSVWFAE